MLTVLYCREGSKIRPCGGDEEASEQTDRNEWPGQDQIDLGPTNGVRCNHPV